MNSYKEKQFLVFEFDNKKTVKYDLSTSEFIGVSGKRVKSLNSHFANINIDTMINSFEDRNYKRFLNYVYNRLQNRYCCNIRNIGTFLGELKRYSKYEQIFSSGIVYVDINDGLNSIEMKDIPKGLIKLCKAHDICFSSKLVHTYKIKADLINYICNNLEEYTCLTKSSIIGLLQADNVDNNGLVYWDRYKESFNSLLDDYNYNIKSLLAYLEDLYNYEGLTSTTSVIRELYDYVRMSSQMNPKFEKYPKCFLTTHAITSRNYNRHKHKFDEDAFNKRIDTSLEFKYKDYQIIYPKTTQEIKDEGCKLNHCVASFINKVIEGRCHILFLRKKDDLGSSLVTLEIRNSQIVQAKGLHNRSTTLKEQEVIDAFNAKYKENKNITNNMEVSVC